jgi:hypothetical protein
VNLIVSDSLSFRHNPLATGRFLTVISHLCLRLGPQLLWLREVAVEPPAQRLPTVIGHRTLTPPTELFIAEVRTVVAELGSRPGRLPR